MEEQNNQPNGALVSKEKSSKGTAETSQPIASDTHAANPPNGQRSTGAETTAGADNSSPSSYRHGMFAQHLLRPSPQGERDREAYNALARRVWEQYRPEGFLEEFLVEKIVTEMVRYARVIGHEQRRLGYITGFLSVDIDKILRYTTSSERQLMRSIRELERVQGARKTVSDRAQNSAAELQDARPSPDQPRDNANWNAVGSIISRHESKGESTSQGSSPAKGAEITTRSTSSAQNPSPTAAPSVSPFMRTINESAGLPPDFPKDRKCIADPPAPAEDDGPATQEK